MLETCSVNESIGELATTLLIRIVAFKYGDFNGYLNSWSFNYDVDGIFK